MMKLLMKGDETMFRRRGCKFFTALMVVAAMVFSGFAGLGTAKAATAEIAINATNFPDPVFRKYIKENKDLDGNGKLNDYEIQMAWDITLEDNSGVKSIKGVEYFSNLLHLVISGNPIESVDISKNTKLKEFYAGELSSVDVSKNTALEMLSVFGLKEVNVSNNKELRSLEICGTTVKTLDLSKNTKLTYLNANSCENLASVKVPAGIEDLYLGWCPIASLDVSGFTNLKDLGINDTGITSINLSKNKALEGLWIDSTAIESIDLSNNTNLKMLWAFGSSLKSLNLSKNTALEVLDITSCRDLKNVDVSNNTKIETFYYDPDRADTDVKMIAFTAKPQSVSAAAGDTVKFSVKVKGPFLSEAKYQWQAYNPATKKWVNSSAAGNKTATLTLKAQTALNGFMFRCVVTDRNGKTYNSASATLAMAPTITTQPAGKIVPVGGTAEFTVAAKGAGTLSYQWQAYNPSTQKWVNSVAACAKTATYTITAQAVHQGFKFRCVVSDAFGNKTTTNAANLVVRPGLTAQPNNATVKVGETAKFTIGAKGVGKLSYQWQVWDAATQTWKNSASASAKTATFSFAAQKGHNGKQFRCIVTDVNGNKTYSRTVTLTVK